MTKANIYVRFSPRKDAAACQSIEVQLEVCRRYCRERGYETPGEPFADPAWSGDDEGRPGIWAAISALKRGYVLVAAKGDRLARSVLLSEYIYREVARKQARIEVVDGTNNGEEPQDVLVRQVMSAFAEYEKKVIAARTSAAMLYFQATGLAMSKLPPFGKIRVGKRLVDNPAELAVVERVLVDRAAGHGLRAIARRLQSEGVPCRGRIWHHATVARITRMYGNRYATAPPYEPLANEELRK